jgi:hypothetical protein
VNNLAPKTGDSSDGLKTQTAIFLKKVQRIWEKIKYAMGIISLNKTA